MEDAVSTRREIERRDRREQILQAAGKVFGRKPFDEASMQEIAADAGIGMQVLYAHFSSKQKLYESVVIERLDAIERQIAEAPVTSDPMMLLEALATLYAKPFLERPQFFTLWSQHKLAYDWKLSSRFAPALRDRFAAVEQRVAAALAVAVEEGVLQPLDPALLLGIAIGIFNSVIQYHVLKAPSRDPEACVEMMLGLLQKCVGRGR